MSDAKYWLCPPPLPDDTRCTDNECRFRGCKKRQALNIQPVDEPESPDEMLSRVRLMAADEGDWDLSANDITALRWLLSAYDHALGHKPQEPKP